MSLESLLSWQQIFFFKFFFSTHIGLNSKSSKKTNICLQKPHTCEDGTHLRISAWHLLINFKKLDNLKTWSYKNVRTLTFTMLYFFKKQKNTWRYHYFTPVYQTSSWYDLQFLRYRVWQTEIGNYGPFLIQDFEKMKKIAGDIILHMCTINKNRDVWVLRYEVQQTNVFFVLLPP